MANMLPAIFFGHGNPMNAVTINGHTQHETPGAKAILSISAPWFVLRLAPMQEVRWGA